MREYVMCVVCIVCLQVHGREIIDKMLKAGCNNRNAFDWLSQLRLYWEEDDCAIRQTNTQFV